MHDCLRSFLEDWDAKTQHTVNIVYGDDVCRQTRFFLGGLLGDHRYVYCSYLTYCAYLRNVMFLHANQPLHVIAALQPKGSCYPLLFFSVRPQLRGKRLFLKRHQAKTFLCVGCRRGNRWCSGKKMAQTLLLVLKQHITNQFAKELALTSCIMPFGL